MTINSISVGGSTNDAAPAAGRPETTDDHIDEQSPLLQPVSTSQDDGDNSMSSLGDGYDSEELSTRSSWYMLLLTLGAFGLQIGWSVEMSNGSPYLLSLGLNKALLALVWIAGPLSGVVIQPYVGIKSDGCRSKWGKRRPFIVGGAAATVLSLIILAWTREIMSWTLGIFGAGPDSDVVKTAVMLFAVMLVYVLDFSINVCMLIQDLIWSLTIAVQAAQRAFAVDCVPIHQQESANAWISRLLGVGNIVGMFCGGLHLTKVFPFPGMTQFKALCSIASVSIAVTTAISVLTIHERDPRSEPPHPNKGDNLVVLFMSLWRSVFRLPPQISKVCLVQFLAWMGWFPVLFYTTTYVGGIYAEPLFRENPHRSPQEIDEIWEAGTRHGSVAMLWFSIVTFVASVLLPFIVSPAYKEPDAFNPETAPMTPIGGSISGSGFIQKTTVVGRFYRQLQDATDGCLTRVQISSLTLRRLWLYSHILFAVCMLLTFFVSSVAWATALIGLVGIPWAITMWAPFALISAEISKRDAIRRGLLRPTVVDGAGDDVQLLAAGEDDAVDQAGVVLGIHNVSISAPQIVSTLAGSLLFSAIQKPRGAPGDESVAWFFRLSGLVALAAAWLTRRVEEERPGAFVRRGRATG
jgi:solute carrier family 45 protein 1/2/4